MPEWLAQTVNVLQLVLNVAAVVGAAAIWKIYVGSLKAALTAKEAAVSSVEKNRDMWKDKAQELEKRSPEFMERLLTERIGFRDAEILRLARDRESNSESLRNLEQEKLVLRQYLERTVGFRAMLALDGEEDEEIGYLDDLQLMDDSLQVKLLGMVAVDSGQLMITDPAYVDSEWEYESYSDVSAIKDRSDGPGIRVVDNSSPDPSADPGTEASIYNYSYNGACQATISPGHGELGFRLGHRGAGVAFSTAFGDGLYPVYGEKHDGRIMRVYINVG